MWHQCSLHHDDVIKWKHFPHYWPFVKGIHEWLVDSPPKGQWCGALAFSLICASTNAWANNWDASDLKCHLAHYNVTVMMMHIFTNITLMLRGCWDISNQGQLDYLFKRLFSSQQRKRCSALLALCEGKPLVANGFPSQRDPNVSWHNRNYCLIH